MSTNVNKQVKSAVRILDLLEVFDAARVPLGVNELARRLDIPKSSVSLLLKTLNARGYLKRDANGLYRQSESAASVPASRTVTHLIAVAKPVLEALVEETGESVFLGVLTPDGQVQYVDKAVTTQEVRYDADIATPRPAHLVSTGRVLLAFGAQRTTPTEQGDSGDESMRIRTDGHACNIDVRVRGASGVAAPIFGSDEDCRAALNISAPTSRFVPAQRDLTNAVMRGAAEISRRLRWSRDGITRPRTNG